MDGEFQIEVIDGRITLFVLWPGILKMNAQAAYDIAHVLIEEANKLRRETSETKITFTDDEKGQ